MKIILHKNKLIKFILNEKNLGFVPTMGSIHKGHISLIKRSIKECSKTVVSIYINKPQFNRKSDFNKYPRNISLDVKKLKKVKVDILFLPKTNQIYPDGKNKNIKINSFKKKLCGKNRPGHFEAVADVIDRFIKIINPKRIYFGEKDMQQLKIIEHFLKKNHPKTKVVSCKNIREKNGIPCSSRNNLLSKIEKKINIRKINEEIYKLGVKKIDYIKLLDSNKLVKPYKRKKKYKIFVAYYLKSTRLIDNI